MGIQLLSAAVAGTVGNKVDVHSIDSKRIALRIDATGGYSGDVVTIEHSPDNGTTWILVGTLASGAELVIRDPVDTIRAKCGASLSGAATVYAEISG